MGDINLIEIPIYIINFIVTFVLLYILLYKPVSKFLGDRQERIANALKEAETVNKEAEVIHQEAIAELASTSEKAKHITHEAVDNAALEAENIIDNAQEKAAEIISRAHAQMEAERHAAMDRAYTELVLLAGGLASRILSREVTIEDNREIADQFFDEKKEQDKRR